MREMVLFTGTLDCCRYVASHMILLVTLVLVLVSVLAAETSATLKRAPGFSHLANSENSKAFSEKILCLFRPISIAEGCQCGLTIATRHHLYCQRT